MSYKIAKLTGKMQQIITLETIVRKNLVEKVRNTSKPTIITTVYPNTHIMHAEQIKILEGNQLNRFVPYYAPLIYEHYSNPTAVSLIVGDSNHSLQKILDPNRIITIEEVCRALPEKVPLSQRDRDCKGERERLSMRIGRKIEKNKAIQFDNILLVNPSVKMWDQAFQIILDCQPTPLIVPYLKLQHNPEQLYRLTLQDFLSGLKTIHGTVSTAVKTHPLLNIKRFDAWQQIKWLMREVASEGTNVSVDEYYLTQSQLKAKNEYQLGNSSITIDAYSWE